MVTSFLDQKLTGRILVIDDEPVVRETLVEILRQQKHEVLSAGDGAEGLQLLEECPVDLVLCDLYLPGMSGIEVLSKAKARFPHISVVVITGQPNLNQAVTAMKKGAADFIPKPFTIDYIHHVVYKNLQEQRLYSENQRLLAELNNKAVIEKLNRQLHQKVTQITKLYNISESFHQFVDNRSLLQYVVDLASDLTGARRVSLLSFDRRKQYLIMRASKGVSSDVVRQACIKIGEGVAGKVAETLRPARMTSRDLHQIDEHSAGSYATSSWLSVPLFIAGELFGVLNVTDKEDSTDFSDEDENVLLVLAEKTGVKLENNVLYEGIYSNLLDTLKALVSTIEAKDSYTRSHSLRVTQTALTIARHIGLSEEECESISFAGILHDIGKIGIQDSILQKKGRLTDVEYETIKKHPVIGDNIIQPLGLIEVERDIILHHHERMDGRGYPHGLKGDEISLFSRIVSLADSFDAMTSTRSYRKAQNLDYVRREIRAHAGSQFDPDLANEMLTLMDQGQIRVPIERIVNDTAPAPTGEEDWYKAVPLGK